MNAETMPFGKPRSLGIGWQLGGVSGWGVFGTQLALKLLRSSQFEPIPLVPPLWRAMNPLHAALLAPALASQQRLQKELDAHPGETARCDFCVLKELSNDFDTGQDAKIIGKRTVGVMFLEDTNFSAAGLAAGRAYDAIVAGSTWNAQVLAAQGFCNLHTALQGIDRAVFHPAPKSGLFQNRFVIFSGGKLEFRKGQDLVVAAFRIFQKRHREAVLMTAWHNFWPHTMHGIERPGHVVGVPQQTPDGLAVGRWLVDNGVPLGSFIDLGSFPNHVFGQIVREADVGLFPSRCEGGTNLVAMEAMACGVPVILSANTGHLDLLRPGCCYASRILRPVLHAGSGMGVEGWGESDVDELVELLERSYQRRDEARQVGEAGAAMMVAWDWDIQLTKLLSMIDPLLRS